MPRISKTANTKRATQLAYGDVLASGEIVQMTSFRMGGPLVTVHLRNPARDYERVTRFKANSNIILKRNK